MSEPRWEGSQGMNEDPTSPKFSDSSSGPVWTKIYRGPYGVLAGNMPQRLQSIGGADGLVDTVLLEKQPGGVGVLTISCTPNPKPSPGKGTSTDTPRLEVEWIEVQKRLETHPRYQADGASALTDADLQAIDVWRNSGGSDRTAKYAGLSENAKNLAGKILKGQDSYIVFAPLIRRTTPITHAPTQSAAGKIQAPPLDVAGYTFLKTADRYVDKGSYWAQVEEWTGAEKIDKDIYDDAV